MMSKVTNIIECYVTTINFDIVIDHCSYDDDDSDDDDDDDDQLYPYIYNIILFLFHSKNEFKNFSQRLFKKTLK